MPSRFDKFKGIVKSLMSQQSRSASAAEMPGNMMDSRKKRLEKIGPKNTGGMFDIIYKKRKETESALGEIDY